MRKPGCPGFFIWYFMSFLAKDYTDKHRYFFFSKGYLCPCVICGKEDFLSQDFFLPLDLDDDFFLGTFAPLFRASESPIAIACLRLFTFLPLRPLLSVPVFFSCIARFTFF
jgi:hypothetical protein